MQEAINWICVDQDLKHYIAWLGHNDFSPKADFRIVLGSLTSLLHRIKWVTECQFHDLVSLARDPWPHLPVFEKKISLGHPENLA